jgi:hypothetical protein
VVPTTPSTPTNIVPLPVGIASGAYQAVHQSGRTCRVDVPGTAPATPVRELYTVDTENGERWFLIRIVE